MFIQLNKSLIFRVTELMAAPVKIGAGSEISQLTGYPEYGLDV